MHDTFRSLAIGDFRLFVSGHFVSQSGTWMQRLAVIWAVFEITDSGTATGVASFCLFGPSLVLSPLAGLLADRREGRNILVATKVGLAGCAIAFTLVGFAQPSSPVPYLVVALGFGIVETFDIPARMTFVAELVDRPDLSNAVGLNTAAMNASRVIGPTIGGILISTAGVEWTFVVNFAFSLTVLASMIAIKPKYRRSRAEIIDVGGVLTGFRVAWFDRTIRNVLLVYTSLSMLVMTFPVTLPLLAERELGGGAGTFTLLFASLSFGSIFGALVVARQAIIDLAFLGRMALLVAVAMSALAVAPGVLAAALLALVVGTSTMAFTAGGIAAVQLGAPAATRGRVLALVAMISIGSRAIGGLLMGWIVDVFNARIAIGLGGFVAMVSGIVGLVESQRLSRGERRAAMARAGHSDVRSP